MSLGRRMAAAVRTLLSATPGLGRRWAELPLKLVRYWGERSPRCFLFVGAVGPRAWGASQFTESGADPARARPGREPPRPPTASRPRDTPSCFVDIRPSEWGGYAMRTPGAIGVNSRSATRDPAQRAHRVAQTVPVPGVLLSRITEAPSRGPRSVSNFPNYPGT
jgi:hypothetical protein